MPLDRRALLAGFGAALLAAGASACGNRARQRRTVNSGACAGPARISRRAAGRDHALYACARSAARLAARQPSARVRLHAAGHLQPDRKLGASPAAATQQIWKQCWRSSPTLFSMSARPAKPSYRSPRACRTRPAFHTRCLTDASPRSRWPIKSSVSSSGGTPRRRNSADYARRTLAAITERIADVTAEQRPRVYYARGPRGLVTGLGGSINVETIELIGRNVAGGTPGGLANVSIEQVLLWNPDVIITIDQEFAATVRSDPSWASVKAVRDNRVHLSPKMPFGWVDFPPRRQPLDRACGGSPRSFIRNVFPRICACSRAISTRASIM